MSSNSNKGDNIFGIVVCLGLLAIPVKAIFQLGRGTRPCAPNLRRVVRHARNMAFVGSVVGWLIGVFVDDNKAGLVENAASDMVVGAVVGGTVGGVVSVVMDSVVTN
jgi:hypothetical protein